MKKMLISDFIPFNKDKFIFITGRMKNKVIIHIIKNKSHGTEDYGYNGGTGVHGYNECQDTYIDRLRTALQFLGFQTSNAISIPEELRISKYNKGINTYLCKNKIVELVEVKPYIDMYNGTFLYDIVPNIPLEFLVNVNVHITSNKKPITDKNITELYNNFKKVGLQYYFLYLLGCKVFQQELYWFKYNQGHLKDLTFDSPELFENASHGYLTILDTHKHAIHRFHYVKPPRRKWSIQLAIPNIETLYPDFLSTQIIINPLEKVFNKIPTCKGGLRNIYTELYNKVIHPVSTESC